jgi:hypothetical protein
MRARWLQTHFDQEPAAAITKHSCDNGVDLFTRANRLLHMPPLDTAALRVHPDLTTAVRGGGILPHEPHPQPFFTLVIFHMGSHSHFCLDSAHYMILIPMPPV